MIDRLPKFILNTILFFINLTLSIFKKIPFLILLFPIILVLYIIIFNSNLSYNEDIIINSNIDNVMKLHEDPSLIKNYMNGFISYNIIKGKSRETGSVAEITVIFNPKKPISRKIVMVEEIVISDLPNQKIITYNTGSVKNTITYRFLELEENKTQFSRIHEYEFNTYNKVSSFFMSKKIKRNSYSYLNDFKIFAENY